MRRSYRPFSEYFHILSFLLELTRLFLRSQTYGPTPPHLLTGKKSEDEKAWPVDTISYETRF
jgi:hypothetical protein